jgi:MarR family transcriptional regulator, transcriptional regulator for hemolysin
MPVEKQSQEWQWDKGPIGRLVKTAYLTLRAEVEKELKAYGITHTQWSALGIILYFPGITLSELEPILMIERPSVTSLINGLEKRGLVIRKDHPTDGRYKLIYLTDKGKELAEETRHLANKAEEKVKANFTEADFKNLKQLLIKLVRSFE